MLDRDQRLHMDTLLSAYRPMDVAFPYNEFISSCLIYTKGHYGIFMIQNKKEEMYTVKVSMYSIKDPEINISLYIKQYAGHIPNILHFEHIYVGGSPLDYRLFLHSTLDSNTCLNTVPNLRDIFIHNKYFYYMTKACIGNLSYYTGKLKQKITYQQFVGYTFQVLVGLQSLHKLNIWHKDIKAANFLICNSDIFPYYPNIIYTKEEGSYQTSWKFSYENLDYKDIKIIDFGEAVILENNNIPCVTYQFEVNVAIINVIKVLWNAVSGYKDEYKYNDLIHNLRNCNTDLLDVMISSVIFQDNISETYNEPNDYIVKLL